MTKPLTQNILICIPSYTFGGAEIHSLYTAQAIKKNTDYTVYFLAFGRIDTFRQRLNDNGFKTLHFPLNDFLNLSYSQKAVRLFKLIRFLKPYQFKYMFSGTEQCNLLMALMWKVLGVKKFFWHQWGIDTRTTIGFFEKLAATTKPAYIANSLACKEDIISRHSINNNNSVKIIHNTFNEALLKVNPNYNSTDFNLIMIANFFEEKDHATVLRALKLFVTKYPETLIKLYFAGRDNGSAIYLKSKALAFDLALQNYVVFSGNVADVAAMLSIMQVGILSTKSEGLSNALLEYMAAGLPVIATDISQNREALGEQNNEWLFGVGDEQKCFQLIEKLYFDKTLLGLLGKQNRAFVKENFSNEIYEKKIIELINGLNRDKISDKSRLNKLDIS
jgi:glycosyltransferase involved in cell wall biosynthesis